MSIQRLPVQLWDSLQETCYRHDNKFIQDISRIIGIPAKDIKRKVFGTRGVLTTVVVEEGPWWVGLQCAVMTQVGYMWRRCGVQCESHGSCWEHRGLALVGRRFNDVNFKDMPLLTAFNYDGSIYWVAKDGTAYDSCGMPAAITVDLNRRLVYLQDGSQKIDRYTSQT